MATLRELIIKISANSQSFQTEISRASRMGADYYKTMQNGGRQAAAATRETQKSIAELNEQLNLAKATALSTAGAFAGAFATGHLIQIADEWVSVNARLKQASSSTDDFTASQRALMDISQRTGTAFSDNANLFSRSAASMREYGYSSDEILKITEAISTGLKLSGASAEESSSVITQFSQALAQGVLRGEEFNAVNEAGDRVIRALASGMGVARKDLKAMADAGQLTANKVVPALISQLGTLRAEYVSMPQTVSAATTSVENAFMAWVGGANEASGATRTLTTGLNAIAGNINEVATAAGALVAIGAARFFGNLVSGATSATVGLVNAARSEVALAEAQLRGTQVSTARARATVYRAQQALVAARATDAQAAAEKRLSLAQASLSRNLVARTAAQTALNSVTSIGGRLLGSLTGLVGGPVGMVLTLAATWYTLYQNQEQARRSAQEYANTIDDVRSKTSGMTLSDASDNEGKTRQALDEQNRLVTEQENKVNRIKNEIAGFRQILESPGLTIGNYMVNHLMSVSEATDGLAAATDALAVEQERLGQMQAKSESIQSVLEGLEHRRIALIRQQAAEQNTAYQSLLMMNGQHTEFNRLLGLGNTLLMARQGLVNAPMRLPEAAATQKQTDALQQSRQDLELSRLKGADRERKRLGYAADALGLTADPQFQTNRQAYISQGMERWQNDEANKPKPKGPKSDEEKAEDVYGRLVKQQRESIALSGQNTELAKVKYQVTQGELAVISDAHKQDLLRNAAALDHVNAVEKLKSLNEQLMTPEETLLNITRERIKLLKEAAPATEEYRKTMEKISKATIQDAPKFDGIDASVGGASGELIKVADAQAELEKWHKKQLEMQKSLLDEKAINEQTYADRVADINKTNTERLKDIQAGYTSASLSMFSDLAGQSAQLLQSIGQEGSLAYKTLFFASKAAAIAQAIINTELAATKAMAEGGLIMGIPAATAIRAVGYASVGLIAGQTLAGMAHDGIDRVPETGTWLLQKGERVVTASTSAKLDATLDRVKEARQGQAGVGEVHFHNSFSGKPDDATMLALESRLRESEWRIKKGLTAQVINPDGEFGRALKSVYPNRRQS